MAGSYIQMRRVGKPATCRDVKDVFRLDKKKCLIGRSSLAVDLYINSSVHPKLISREHAVITSQDGPDGSITLTIQDKSVNGTFVNDEKIQGTVPLYVGDVVTFGHLQGIKVKPWQVSKQLNSEFQFKVEKVEVSPDAKASISPGLRRPLAHLSNTHHCQTTKVQGQIKLQDSSKDELCEKQQSIPAGNTLPDNNNNEVLRETVLQDKIPVLVDKREHDSLQQRTDSEVNNNPSPNSKRGLEFDSMPSSGDKAQLSSLSESNLLPKQLILGVPACRVQATTTKKATPPLRNFSFPALGTVNNSTKTGVQKDIGRTGKSEPEKPRIIDARNVFDFSENDSDEDLHAITTEVKTKVQQLMDDEEEDSFSPRSHSSPIKKPAPSTSKNRSPVIPIRPQEKVQDTRRHSIPLTGLKSALSASGSKINTRKRKSDGLLPSAKRTVTSSDICSAVKCLQPVGIMIPWVQCDDCDLWFHTNCAGCNFEEVRKPSASFHCGCV